MQWHQCYCVMVPSDISAEAGDTHTTGHDVVRCGARLPSPVSQKAIANAGHFAAFVGKTAASNTVNCHQRTTVRSMGRQMAWPVKTTQN